jgi:hypothetical protein
MGFISVERGSDSPFVEKIYHGYSAGEGSTVRPAESHWHMVFSKFQGRAQTFMVGPLTSAGVVPFTEGAEILWLKFKHGAFMPHLPLGNFLDQEASLPEASSNSFWLNGSAWQFPDFENADTFLNRLARRDILTFDPLVSAVLQKQPHDYSPRTVRHRFLRATGLSRNQILQIERAQRAAALLEQGLPILDTVSETGYFDQPHLTRALKLWVGQTPFQLLRERAKSA